MINQTEMENISLMRCFDDYCQDHRLKYYVQKTARDVAGRVLGLALTLPGLEL